MIPQGTTRTAQGTLRAPQGTLRAYQGTGRWTGGSGVAPSPDPYIGLIATRAGVSSAVSVATNKVMARRAHYFPAAFNDCGVVFPNWYVNASGIETGAGGAVALTVSIELMANTTFVKLVNAVSVADLGTYESTPVALGATYPAGWYWIRTFADWSAGLGMAVIDDIGADSNFNAPLGDVGIVSGATDQTMSGTMSGSAQSSSICMGAIIGTTRLPGLALVGDSRVFGIQDTGDSTGDLALLARSIGYLHFGYTKLAKSGGTYAAMAAGTNFDRRMIIGKYATHCIMGPQTNDIRTGTTPATAYGYYSTMVAKFTYYNIPCDICTMERWTDGAWTAPDGSDQTPNANEANRVTFNAGVLALTNVTNQRYGYEMSLATALVNLGVTHDEFWQPGTTDDGHHANHTGYLLHQASGHIPLANYTRSAPVTPSSPFFADARMHAVYTSNTAWWNGQIKLPSYFNFVTRTTTNKQALQSSGAYTTFGAATLAITDLGLSAEEAASNILGFSNAVNSTSWVATQVTLTAGQTSPDGASTATLVNENTTASISHNFQPASKSFTAGQNYQIGAWVAPATGAFLQLLFPAAGGDGTEYANFDPATGTITKGGSMVAATAVLEGSFWHVTCVGPAAAGGGARSAVCQVIASMAATRQQAFAGAGKTLTIWQPQVTLSSATLWIPRSPIITTSSVTVARNADNIAMQQSTWMVPAGQTMFIKARVAGNLVVGATALAGNADKGVQFAIDSGGTKLRMQVFHGSQRGDTGTNGPAITAGSIVKAALSYDGVGTPLFSVNGTTVANSATPSQADWDTSALQVGARNTAGTPSNFWNDFVQEVYVGPVHTQAELNVMTT